MDSLSLGAAFLAGILTILSPCILPILPIIFGSATNMHRYGPVALGLGLSTGFAAIGLLIATVGYSVGFNPDLFRYISATLLITFGLILIIPAANNALQAMLAPIGRLASKKSDTVEGNGLFGQFGLGILLGAVWSPCVGPTLGAATLLASRGEALFEVTLTMILFGIGVALPLTLLGIVGRKSFNALRGKMTKAGNGGRWLLAGGMIFAGIITLTGWDKVIEIWMLDNGPAWMTEWATMF